MPEHAFRKEMESIDRWINELRSLGVAAKKPNTVNDEKELQDLADNIKQSMYRDYKTAYSDAG